MTQKPEELEYDPDWQSRYADLIKTPEQASAMIRPGQRVFIGTGCGEPQALVRAFCQRRKGISDIEIVHLLTLGDAPYASPEMADYFSVNSFFIAENVRGVIQEGLGDYTPIFLSDIPALFTSGRLPLDVALIQVTPPDTRGKVSLGVSVDIVKSAAQNASLVIAQVNPRMPRTLGGSFMDVIDLDALVPVDEPIIERPPEQVDEVTNKIGEHIASLVEDGATLEFGIGRIPQSVLMNLGNKKNLGVHTEMITDSIMDLMDAGVINGARKSMDRGKVVASFCVGTRRLYDRIHNNPAFGFHPTEYVNDPALISRQNKMVAINMALQIDLTGQVCADSIGSRFFSGIGGQVDFNRGAAKSSGGKAIIAMPSTARDGAVSRIVSRLTEGAGVVTTRGDVHYVITEYGVAYLHGKSVQERAIALISVAHPAYREGLLKEAIEARYVRPEKADVEGAMMVAPQEFRAALTLDDGTQVSFRPIRPTDEGAVKDLMYALSQKTVYYRFMSNIQKFPHRQIQNYVYIDNRRDVAIVGALPEAYGEEIIAMGRYYLDERTNRAEVAFIVRDQWQGRGIGKFMLKSLITIARQNGISGFTAEVLQENKPMQAVFNGSGLKVRSELEEGVLSLIMDFE